MQTIRNRKVLGVAAVIALATLAACSEVDDGDGSATADNGDSVESAEVPGITDETITLGGLLSLTGTFAAGAEAQLAGATLYWDTVNENGGVCDGRTIEIVSRDHAYDPQQAATGYSDIRNQVFAIQLLTGTAMTEAVASPMEADTVSAIPMSWSPDLLGNPSILIAGTTYDLDMINAIDYLVSEGTLAEGDTIGYVYFQGDFGEPGLEGATYAAEQYGITVREYQVDPSVTDMSSQVGDLVSEDAKAIFMSTSPPLLANAAALAATAGLDVPFVVPTPTFVPQLLQGDAAEQLADRVMVVSPYNAWSANASGVEELRTEYEEAQEDEVPQQFYLAGYAAAQLMHSALETTCEQGDLTRETLAETFASATEFEMNGVSVDLSYADREESPSAGNYILIADADAEGGLTPLEEEPFQGQSIESYLQQD